MTGFDWLDDVMDNGNYRRRMYGGRLLGANGGYLRNNILELDPESDEDEDSFGFEADERWNFGADRRQFPKAPKPKHIARQKQDRDRNPTHHVLQSTTVPYATYANKTEKYIGANTSSSSVTQHTVNLRDTSLSMSVSTKGEGNGQTTTYKIQTAEGSHIDTGKTKASTIIVAAAVSFVIIVAILLAILYVYLRKKRRRKQKAIQNPTYDEIHEQRNIQIPPLSPEQEIVDLYSTINSSANSQYDEHIEDIQNDTCNVYDHLEHFSRNLSEYEDTVPKSDEFLDSRLVIEDCIGHSSNSTQCAEYDHLAPVAQNNSYSRLERTNADEHSYLKINPALEKENDIQLCNDNHKYFVLEPQTDKLNAKLATIMPVNDVTECIEDNHDTNQTARNSSVFPMECHEYFVLEPDYVDGNVTNNNGTAANGPTYYTLDPSNQ